MSVDVEKTARAMNRIFTKCTRNRGLVLSRHLSISWHEMGLSKYHSGATRTRTVEAERYRKFQDQDHDGKLMGLENGGDLQV